MRESKELEKAILKADLETYKHCLNVAKMTEIMLNSEQLKNEYTPSQKEDIIFAARYHDIGKSEIDKNILYAPRKLTDEEFKVMITHAGRSENIIKKEDFTDVLESEKETEQRGEILKNICKYHHSRQDGRGYPPLEDGMDKAPEYTEIVGIVDVFEALTADRVYKRTFTIEEAKIEILTGREFFSDKMKNVFLEELDKLSEIVMESKKNKIADFVTFKQKKQELGLENTNKKEEVTSSKNENEKNEDMEV